MIAERSVDDSDEIQPVADDKDDEEEIQSVADGEGSVDDSDYEEEIQSVADSDHAVHQRKRKINDILGGASTPPAWVERACELLVKGKIKIPRVAQQVRRVAQKNAENIDFDVLLELEEERCLDARRISELQDELNL